VRISIINGPNLNLLGIREPQIYGSKGFDVFIPELQQKYANQEISYFQSNVEGELINRIQADGLDKHVLGIVLNAGAYSHTSIAIADSIKSVPAKVVNVHISNIYAREKERHTDLIAGNAAAVIAGMGLYSYEAAILFLLGLGK
jgi:3-dehydroquinate dehydratase-2